MLCKKFDELDGIYAWILQGLDSLNEKELIPTLGA